MHSGRLAVVGRLLALLVLIVLVPVAAVATLALFAIVGAIRALTGGRRMSAQRRLHDSSR